MSKQDGLDEASTPDGVIAYWGGSAVYWERVETGVIAIRSHNHPEDFRSFMRDFGGDPTGKQYWLFPIADKERVLNLVVKWAEDSVHDRRRSGWGPFAG